MKPSNSLCPPAIDRIAALVAPIVRAVVTRVAEISQPVGITVAEHRKAQTPPAGFRFPRWQ